MRFAPLYIVLGLLVGGCEAGCRDTLVAPQAPARMAAQPQPVRVPSTIYMPIQIPIAQVTDVVNEVVPRTLYQGRDHKLRKGILTVRLDLDIRRNGTIRMEPSDDALITHIPLRAEGVLKNLGTDRDFSMAFTVHARSDIHLNAGWEFISKTRSSFTWREEPRIQVFGIKFSIARVAGEALTQKLAELGPQIDEKLRTSIKTQDLAVRLWNDINQPIVVSQDPPAWLDVEPLSFHFSPMQTQTDTVVFGLRTVTFIEMVMDRAPAEASPDPMPPLQAGIDSTNSFNIDLAVSVPFSSAEEILSAALADKAFTVKDRVKVRIKDFEVYASGPSLVAGIDFTADIPGRVDVDGKFFLKGIPVYEDSTRTIRIDSLQYDVDSRNRLAEVAAWMLHDRFIETIQERLVLPVGDEIELARARLEEALDRQPVGTYVMIDGTVERLAPGRLYLSDEAIHVKVSAGGQIDLAVQSLPDVNPKAPS